MARINIEDQFWTEIIDIAVAMADKDKAIGNAVRFFKHSQDAHKAGKYISEEDFKAHGFSESLFPVFAKRVDGGIQAVGADKHFAWLKARAEAGAKGGASKSPKKLANLKQNRSTSEAKPKLTEPSSSYSSSFSNSLLNPSSEVGERPSPDANRKAWLAYHAAYLLRYKVEPTRNATVNSAIANFVKRVGEKDAPEILKFFVLHNDGYYLKNAHAVTLALKDAESLRTQWLTGKPIGCLPKGSPAMSIKARADDLCHTITSSLIKNRTRWNLDRSRVRNGDEKYPTWIDGTEYSCDTLNEAIQHELGEDAFEAIEKMGGAQNLYQEFSKADNKTFLRAQLRDLIMAHLERDAVSEKNNQNNEGMI